MGQPVVCLITPHYSMIMMIMMRRKRSRMMLLHRKVPVEKKSCTRREGRSTVTTDPGHEKRRVETRSKKERIIRNRNDAIKTGGN